MVYIFSSNQKLPFVNLDLGFGSVRQLLWDFPPLEHRI